MEMISIPRIEYEKMINQIEILKKIEKIDVGLIRQFQDSLSDVKDGRILRVA